MLPSPSDIQRVLPAGTAIVEYALIPSGVAIFCLTPSSLTAAVVPLDRAALRGTISDFRAAVEYNDERAANDLGRRLYQLILMPIRDCLAGVTSLIFVADRDLQSVPFATLIDGATGRYIVEDRALSLAPSATLVADPGPAQTANDKPLIVANPTAPQTEALPAAEREAEALGRIYGNSVVLSRDRATKRRFLAEAPKPSPIHVGGHARVEGRGPAALLLADGPLDAGEIGRLNLSSAGLVVVGACSSARGETRRMEGVPSLARAFIAAGVP